MKLLQKLKKIYSTVKRATKASFAVLVDIFKFQDFESSSAGEQTFRLPPEITKHMKLAEYDYENELFLDDRCKNSYSYV